MSHPGVSHQTRSLENEIFEKQEPLESGEGWRRAGARPAAVAMVRPTRTTNFSVLNRCTFLLLCSAAWTRWVEIECGVERQTNGIPTASSMKL